MSAPAYPLPPTESPADEPPYGEILTAIVKRFVRLVGAPAALNVARRTPGLAVDDEGNVLSYAEDDPVSSITLLIDQYGSVFGDIALTLSRQAAKALAKGGDDPLLQDVELLPFVKMQPIRVLLVDDHVLFREGLASLLKPQPDILVVGQAGSVAEAVERACEVKPDLILMDAGLPDGTGQEATRAILINQPDVKIMFLTVHEDDEQLFAAIRAGAMGYLLKSVRAAELLKRLRSVAHGEAGVSPAIARRILDEFSRLPSNQPADLADMAELTTREIEIVRELARGATNREIARRLVISENTVKNHVRNVLAKLHLRSRRDIPGYVRGHGFTFPPLDSPR